MARLRRTARAEDDLIEIWAHVAQDDPAAADRLLDRIDGACWRLAVHPRLGPARPDIVAGLRCWVVGRYLVLYREIDGGVEIVRVVHGTRHLPGLVWT